MLPISILDPLSLWHALVAFSSSYRAFAATAAPVAIAALWQGALVATSLALCLRLAARASTAQRFAIWGAGFAALVCLPLLPLLESLAGSTSLRGSGATTSAFSPWVQVDLRWTLIIAALWLAASAVRMVDLAVHSVRLVRLWRAAAPVVSAAEAESDRFQESAQPCNCEATNPPVPASSRQRYEICTSAELDRPSVIGFFRPRILIPDWLYPRLTTGELQQIVLHEAEHLRRHDDWTNLLQKLCLVLFPLNPALWWIERKLCREREMACDESVVNFTRAPRDYAACLASLAEQRMNRRAEALSLGAWQRRPDLADRIHSILRRRHLRALSPPASRALLAALGCGLLAGSIELARCPQLVAFVPEHRARAMHGVASAQIRSDVYTLGPALAPARHFYAVPAKAILPMHAANSTPRHPLAARMTTTDAALPSKTMAARRQTLIAGNKRSASPRVIQQFVVFSAWEEVQTPTSASQSRADYDTPEAEDPPASSQLIAPDLAGNADQPSAENQSSAADKTSPTNPAAQADKNPATRVTILHLIFRVDPSSPTTQGWFVFQL